MSKINLVLIVLFALFILLVNAAENDSLENASVVNEGNAPIYAEPTESGTNESANINSENVITVSSVANESSQLTSESAETNVNIESQPTTEERGKGRAVTASFAVYLQIVS